MRRWARFYRLSIDSIELSILGSQFICRNTNYVFNIIPPFARIFWTFFCKSDFFNWIFLSVSVGFNFLFFKLVRRSQNSIKIHIGHNFRCVFVCTNVNRVKSKIVFFWLSKKPWTKKMKTKHNIEESVRKSEMFTIQSGTTSVAFRLYLCVCVIHELRKKPSEKISKYFVWWALGLIKVTHERFGWYRFNYNNHNERVWYVR